MIDCHCHLIPGIDDGARNDAMVLEMARSALAAGTETLICTPHHLNGVYDNPAIEIRRAVAALRQRLTDAAIPLEVHAGAELHLVPELPGRILDGNALTYNDLGKCALVELPKASIPIGADTILEQLLYRGVTPVIAHPERNQALARHPERLAEWLSWGCRSQVTAQSCCGDFGEPLQRLCRRWLEQGWVHLIASDAHRPTGRSPGTLAAGYAILAEWIGAEAAGLLTRENPRRLLTGEDLLSISPRRPTRDAEIPRRWIDRLPWRRARSNDRGRSRDGRGRRG